MKKYTTFFAMAMTFVLTFFSAPIAQADSVEVRPFLALGADLTSSERKEVLAKLGLTEADSADYETIEVTNKEEHEYLDEYLASSVIGTRALSSVKIEETDKGNGIEVKTHNISFCTEEMYTNALVTAGIEDAKVTVAGPFKLSGTAALVGAMKAYGVMTGEEISSEQSDAAMNELVVTGELGDAIGKEEAANFVATLKNKVLDEGLSDKEEIEQAIDETAKQFNVTVSDGMKQKMVPLMQKIGGLDLDLDFLKDQAKGVYDKIKDMGIDLGQADGWLDKLTNAFSKMWSSISDFFNNIF